jgi:AraC-like DNA-binding protein
MPITLSHRTYWDLFEENTQMTPVGGSELSDVTWKFPSELGRGFVRQIELRQGIDLAIARYQLHDDLTLHLPEREHPIEYNFLISGKIIDKNASCSVRGGQYALYGSGLAPVESIESLAVEEMLEVSVHIDPDQFLTHWSIVFAEAPSTIQYLIKSASEIYPHWTGTMTVAMQTAVQHILHCPFRGITERIYLESKVWELMSLLLDQGLVEMNHRAIAPRLKPEDVDRIRQARDILLQRFDNPPSLLDLAHQVGLNDCTLKRGFREVFGTTAFGYLHDYRLEKARHLLEERRLNVSETARKVGFANRSYFASAFKKKFGMNPKDYLNHRHSA